ncbi:hypothetical protein AMECASPLE_022394 [Ameca splendens]|uniref:Uncharacterized protein n=1 Tax=Ameca splendens TaxID=208324 RepID=A0ABV0ZZP7_9TELE
MLSYFKHSGVEGELLLSEIQEFSVLFVETSEPNIYLNKLFYFLSPIFFIVQFWNKPSDESSSDVCCSSSCWSAEIQTRLTRSRIQELADRVEARAGQQVRPLVVVAPDDPWQRREEGAWDWYDDVT